MQISEVGSWLVVVKQPNLQSKPMGRYHSRAEAEHVKLQLMRLTGNRSPFEIIFDPQEDTPDLHQLQSLR